MNIPGIKNHWESCLLEVIQSHFSLLAFIGIIRHDDGDGDVDPEDIICTWFNRKMCSESHCKYCFIVIVEFSTYM